MLSSPIRRQARWGRYRGSAWGEARRPAQAAGQRAIARSRRDEARAAAGDDERTAGNRPRQISRRPTPATHARTNCKPTAPAGLTENPACPDQGQGCASGAARPRATAPCDSASAPARRRSALQRGGTASTQDNPSWRRDWLPTPATRARALTPPPRTASRTRRERVRVKPRIAFGVQLGREIRTLDRDRALPLDSALFLHLAPARTPRAASPAHDTVIDRRLPLVPAILTAPPRLPVRSGRYSASIKLAVPGFVKLGGEIRTHPSERPPPGYWTDTAASIARRRPETLLSQPRLRVAPHAGAQMPRTRRDALQEPKRLVVLGQRPPMPDPQMGTAHLSKPPPAEMAADQVIAIVEDLAERRAEHRPVVQHANRSSLECHRRSDSCEPPQTVSSPRLLRASSRPHGAARRRRRIAARSVGRSAGRGGTGGSGFQ